MTRSAGEDALSELLTSHAGRVQTSPPEELVQAVSRLGFDSDYVCGHALTDYDPDTGVSSWQVVLATDTTLVEIRAAAARMIEPYRNGEKYPTDWSTFESNGRDSKTYAQPPNVEVRVRKLKNLVELNVIATGATDSFERPEMVRETWTFTFRDGTDPVVFEIDHSDSERPPAVDDLCRHLAAHL